MRLLAKLAAVTLVIAVAPQLSDNISVSGLEGALFAALVYGLLFVLIGWAVFLFVGLLSIVPGVLTLGLFFLLVPTLVSTVLLKLTAGLVGSFEIRTWGAAFLLGFVLGLVNWLFEGAARRNTAERWRARGPTPPS
jgi:uncharacterized membrane protein YvlD (DUF360 family)